MEMVCIECKGDFSKSRTALDCSSCGGKLHIKCVFINNPEVSQAEIDLIKKSNGAFLFRCKNCINSKSTGSDGNIATSKHNECFKNKITELETAIKKLTNLVSDSVIPDLTAIKSDLANYAAALQKHEKAVDVRISKLEIENNTIRRQLIRGDVLIKGIPSTLTSDEVYDMIPKIGNSLNIQISPQDINMCAYIRNKTTILVKFNSIRKRDELMKKYFENRNLQLDQIMETDIQKRVYLNDNMTPMASRINYLCRKLLQQKVIVKFRIQNSSLPLAKVTLADGSVKLLNSEEANDLLNCRSNQPNVQNSNNN